MAYPLLPPKCPECHKMMHEEQTCGFFCAIEAILRKIMFPAAQTRWACKNEYQYSNRKAVEEWEKRYAPIFQEIEKTVNAKARNYAERQARKSDFNSSMGELEERFKQKQSLSQRAVGAAKNLASSVVGIGGSQNKKNGKPIMIRKRPPDWTCCSNHYKYKTNFYGSKVKRKAYKFFKHDQHGNLVPNRSIF